jgi:hypothetical protein
MLESKLLKEMIGDSIDKGTLLDVFSEVSDEKLIHFL